MISKNYFNYQIILLLGVPKVLWDWVKVYTLNFIFQRKDFLSTGQITTEERVKINWQWLVDFDEDEENEIEADDLMDDDYVPSTKSR